MRFTAHGKHGSAVAHRCRSDRRVLVHCVPRDVRTKRVPRRNTDRGLAPQFLHRSHSMSREGSFRTALAVAAAAVLLWCTPTEVSAGSEGRTLFSSYCAACHGADARGNGPVASALKVQPADLTRLERRFGMPLNRDKIAEYIDGRMDVLAHGSRDMPVWGDRLQDELIGHPATQDTIRRTIDSIVAYLVSIQEIQGALR